MAPFKLVFSDKTPNFKNSNFVHRIGSVGETNNFIHSLKKHCVIRKVQFIIFMGSNFSPARVGHFKMVISGSR